MKELSPLSFGLFRHLGLSIKSRIVRKALLLLFIATGVEARSEPASTSPASPAPATAPARHSFLDPVGDFVRDDILRPVAPFEIVPGKNPSGWSFVLEPYVWALGLTGDIGVKGLPPSHLNLSSRSILQNLDWGIFARGEVRKGRWGLLADGLYAALSASGEPENKIYNNISLDVQQSLVSLALAYRVIDDRRGFLDIYAGARYNYLGLQMDASLNEGRIDEIGRNVANAITAQADMQIDAAVEKMAPGVLSAANQQLTDTISGQLSDRDLKRLILAKNADLRHLVRDEVIRHSLVGSRVRKAVVEYVRAQAQARLAAAGGMANAQFDAAAAKAKKKLAATLSDRIEEVTPTHEAGDQWWVDPIIGLRGQVNLTRWLFLAAQSDVGGFGAGSQIAWNTQATVGVNFTRNIFGEIGYRYYYVDYTNGGFVYDMNSYGLYSSLGVKF